MAATTFPVSFKIERYYDKYYDLTCNLSASDPEALSLPDLLQMADSECLDMWNNMKFGYTHMAGHPLLRQEVAKLHGVETNEILEIIPIEGIFIAMQCLVRYLKSKHKLAKLHAVTTFPAYQSLQENLRLLECKVTDWSMKSTDDGWRFDIEDLKAQLSADTRLLVANFPHNPTGAIPSASEWAAIIDLCRERDIFLFSDEMYRLTNLDGTVPLPSACSIYENSMSLFGLSKTFAMPGLRVGWLCTKNADIRGMMQRFKDYTSVCGSTPCEILGIIALRNADKIIQRTVDICKSNLRVAEEFFNEYPALFDWKSPKACTTGLLRIKGWLLELGEGGATGFCEVLARETGVLLLPASIYNYTPDEYVRFGYGRNMMPDGLKKLKVFLDTYQAGVKS